MLISQMNLFRKFQLLISLLTYFSGSVNHISELLNLVSEPKVLEIIVTEKEDACSCQYNNGTTARDFYPYDFGLAIFQA